LQLPRSSDHAHNDDAPTHSPQVNARSGHSAAVVRSGWHLSSTTENPAGQVGAMLTTPTLSGVPLEKMVRIRTNASRVSVPDGNGGRLLSFGRKMKLI